MYYYGTKGLTLILFPSPTVRAWHPQCPQMQGLGCHRAYLKANVLYLQLYPTRPTPSLGGPTTYSAEGRGQHRLDSSLPTVCSSVNEEKSFSGEILRLVGNIRFLKQRQLRINKLVCSGGL